MLFGRSFRRLQDLQRDEVPAGGATPRLDVINHIEAQIKDCNGPTVGEGIVAAIRVLREAAGEHGARQVDTVFKNDAMTEHYRKPLDDLAAHRAVAEREYEYWTSEHNKLESGGTRTAVSFNVEERVKLQYAYGRLNEMCKAYHNDPVLRVSE